MLDNIRVLVCGGRDFDDWSKFLEVMQKQGFVGERLDGLTVIQGGASGADFLAKVWAKWLSIRCEEYKAEWELHGKGAGHIRNKKMLDTGCDLVIAFPGGRGTQNMIDQANKAGVETVVVDVS